MLVLIPDRLFEGFLVFGAPLVTQLVARIAASTEAACSPPMTEISAPGHIQRKRGL